MRNQYLHSTGTVAAGTSHTAGGKQCEDAISRSVGENGVQAIALCDGAGSAKYAREGADLTAAIAAHFAAEEFEMLYGMDAAKREQWILDTVRRALFAHAKCVSADISELSCTLLLAALSPADGRGFFLHIGDGLVLGRRADGTTAVLSYFRSREHLNVTRFVTSVKTECVTERTADITGFLLTSDGPEPYLTSGERVLRPARLLLELSYLLPEQRMDAEFSSLIEKMQAHGMYDDASFITLTANKEIGAVFDTMQPRIRSKLYGVSDQSRRSTKRRTAEMLELLAENPDGLTLNSLTRILRVHRNRIAKARLEPMLASGAVQCRSGRYYLHASA